MTGELHSFKTSIYALYARQSIDKPDSISVESQLDACRYEAGKHEHRVYVDKGFSGKNTNRPAFARMLADIRAGQIRAVVVYKLDRVSRSVLDFGKMMEEFERYQVAFISATEKFDTQTPMGRAMLNIAMVFAQLERETIQKRVADSYASRSRHGFYMGGRIPYGYRLTSTVIDGVHTASYQQEPKEAEQIKRIFALYANSRNSLGDIVCYLQEHQINQLRGGTWNTARLSELLRNPVYVRADLDVYEYYQSMGTVIVNNASEFCGIYGCYLYKGRRKGGKSESVKDTLVLAGHEGLIEPEVWLACREKCRNYYKIHSNGRSKNTWLAGKVKCGNCGYALTVKKSHTQKGRYFVCSAKYTTKKCKGAGTIYVTDIEQYVGGEIEKQLCEFRWMNVENERPNPQLQTIRLQLTQLTASIETLLDQMEQSTDAAAEYMKQRINQLDEKKRLLQKQFDLLNAASKNSDTSVQMKIKWDSLTFDEKKEIADLFIEVIRIADNQMEIVWKI